jgi:hypothetical protein
MRFRVTSVAGSEEGRRLGDITVAMEDRLAAVLGLLDFGSSIDQFTIVVVSVYDDPMENEEWCKAHRKLATIKNPITQTPMRLLSIAVPISPAEICTAEPDTLPKLVTNAVRRELAVRPKRLPKGLDFAQLSDAVARSLSPWFKSLANSVV